MSCILSPNTIRTNVPKRNQHSIVESHSTNAHTNALHKPFPLPAPYRSLFAIRIGALDSLNTRSRSPSTLPVCWHETLVMRILGRSEFSSQDWLQEAVIDGYDWWWATTSHRHRPPSDHVHSTLLRVIIISCVTTQVEHTILYRHTLFFFCGGCHVFLRPQQLTHSHISHEAYNEIKEIMLPLLSIKTSCQPLFLAYHQVTALPCAKRVTRSIKRWTKKTKWWGINHISTKCLMLLSSRHTPAGSLHPFWDIATQHSRQWRWEKKTAPTVSSFQPQSCHSLPSCALWKWV